MYMSKSSDKWIFSVTVGDYQIVRMTALHKGTDSNSWLSSDQLCSCSWLAVPSVGHLYLLPAAKYLMASPCALRQQFGER